MIRCKRVYAPPAPEDGLRVLVDGLWPRGLSKSTAAVDLWLREIAPSAELRRFFAHDPARWSEFCERYRRELGAPERASALARLRALVREHATVTLLFAAREERYNHARLLARILAEEGSRPRRGGRNGGRTRTRT